MKIRYKPAVVSMHSLFPRRGHVQWWPHGTGPCRGAQFTSTVHARNTTYKAVNKPMKMEDISNNN